MQLFEKSCSIIVPLYFDEDVVVPLCERLIPIAKNYFSKYEIIFVNDGSFDKTIERVREVINKYEYIACIDLVKNVGQQNAISAGIDYSMGELIVVMDSDLQDRPEDIPILVSALMDDSDAYMAIARWEERKDSFLKKTASFIFQKVTHKITGIKHHSNLGIFRVIKREAITEVNRYSEKTAPIMSLLYWIGFKYIPVNLKRDARFAGNSGYNLSKMLKIAFDRIFSYSMLPIRLAIFSGFTIALISFFVGLFLIYSRLTGGIAKGWTSIVVLILFMFGISFIFLGFIGEYLGRIFLESKNRPKYHIHKIYKK
jgi:polyisoprenyl-phosphate glycosyltransferase